jgi:hypothetical protein
MMKIARIDSATGVCRRAAAATMLLAPLVLGACSPTTEVVDLRAAPKTTTDAMQRVTIVPLGGRGLAAGGSIGPVSGLGCGQTPEAASFAAEQQLRVKAMAQHATAVVDVLIEPDGLGLCAGGHNMLAHGIAVGPRGIPPSY